MKICGVISEIAIKNVIRLRFAIAAGFIGERKILLIDAEVSNNYLRII